MKESPRIFGLSTTPIVDIRSELQKQIERDMLALEARMFERIGLYHTGEKDVAQ